MARLIPRHFAKKDAAAIGAFSGKVEPGFPLENATTQGI
jgi:hypothetical protein